jgi:hypothetical protein
MNGSHYYQYTVNFLEVKFEQDSSSHNQYSTFEGFLCFSSLIWFFKVPTAVATYFILTIKATKCEVFLFVRYAVGWGTALQTGKSRVQSPMVSLEFFIGIILPAALRPGVESASNRNEYQEYFLGGKGGRCVWLTTLPPSCADCLEIWEPQSPGTLRACPGL